MPERAQSRAQAEATLLLFGGSFSPSFSYHVTLIYCCFNVYAFYEAFDDSVLWSNSLK